MHGHLLQDTPLRPRSTTHVQLEQPNSLHLLESSASSTVYLTLHHISTRTVSW